jgi:hypothetical protein
MDQSSLALSALADVIENPNTDTQATGEYSPWGCATMLPEALANVLRLTDTGEAPARSEYGIHTRFSGKVSDPVLFPLAHLCHVSYGVTSVTRNVAARQVPYRIFCCIAYRSIAAAERALVRLVRVAGWPHWRAARVLRWGQKPVPPTA